MNLSNADLGVFFEGHHHVLAEALIPHRAAIESLADAEVARYMGAEAGLYQLFGEDPVDVRAMCLVREFLGAVSPLADAIFAVQGLGTYPIVLAGNDEQKEFYVAPSVAGQRVAGFALTEPEAGSDVASMQTTAVRDGDSFVLSGHKTLISNVGIASHFVVFANADPDAGRKGITAFIVDGDSPGLTQEAIALNIDHPIGDLRFDNCRIPATALLGEIGGGFALAMKTLDAFRVTVGAAAVGMARRAIDEALAHVQSRVQFGKPLSTQPIVRTYLADMATELDASRLLVLRAAHAKDAGQGDVTIHAAKAKLYATEASQRIIDRALQLHGGSGVRAGAMVELLYRSIRPLRIYEGTSEIQRLIIGRAMTRRAQ